MNGNQWEETKHINDLEVPGRETVPNVPQITATLIYH